MAGNAFIEVLQMPCSVILADPGADRGPDRKLGREDLIYGLHANKS